MSSAELTEWMAYLVIEDEDQAGRYAAAGIARAREFNWQRTAHLVFAAYQRAVEQHASQATVTGSGQ